MKPSNLHGAELRAYRAGYVDGNESNYFPCCGGKELAAYDWGYEQGQKYGDRKGKPRTLEENLRDIAKMK